ncbi:aspartyl protease family protein At5g10770-like [Fagus crenata]
MSKKLGFDDLRESEASTLPAKSGSTVGSGNYVVTVGLSTPKKDLTLIFDTGTQQGCTSSSTCVYGIQYRDGSFSMGFFGQEKLTLTSNDVFNNFLFGCGQNNQVLFNGSAGLIGLGRNPPSLVQQTAAKYGRVFSYCLPLTPSSTGSLTFGKSARPSSAIKFTPFSKVTKVTQFYGLDTVGISVAGRKLLIAASVFSNSGTIIDSGTVITRLPPTAYSALKTAFRQAMKNYPLTTPSSSLDTCYNLTKYPTFTVPNISFSFNGGVDVDLDASRALVASNVSQVCLAFAANSDDNSLAIFGNVQ